MFIYLAETKPQSCQVINTFRIIDIEYRSFATSYKRERFAFENCNSLRVLSFCISRDLDTIYRPDRKWGPDLVSQVLHALLTSSFVRYVMVITELYPWHHHGGYVTWVQFTEKIENEDQNWYLKFYVLFWIIIFKVMIIKEILNSCWG